MILMKSTATLRYSFASLALCASLAAFGQTKILTLGVTPDGSSNLSFNLGSALADGQTVQVDWGDGNLVSETVTLNERSSTKPTTNFYAVPKGSTVTVYGDPSTINEVDASWATGNLKIESADVSALTKTSYINFASNSLTTLDASACDSLYNLSLNSNKLTTLKLGSPVNLAYLYLQNAATSGENHIVNFESGVLPALVTLQIGYNYLESFDFSKVPNVKNIYFLYNNLSGALDLSSLTSLSYLSVNFNQLTSLNASGCDVQLFALNNKLTEVLLPSTESKNVNVANNCLTFATMPYTSKTLTCTGQADMVVTPEGNKIDLSAQTSYQGTATTFAWTDNSGAALTEGTDYTADNGVFTFLKNFSGLVCTMNNSNAKVKALTLKTVAVDVIANGISAVEADAAGEAVYYNLQGVRVGNPQGGVFIKRQGDKVTKVVVR
jgi:hypothetical protein